MTAASRVLQLPEMLEVILFFLPENDLVTLQRVNKWWRTNILASKTVQQKLFLAPLVAKPQSKNSKSLNTLTAYEWNPFLPTSSFTATGGNHAKIKPRLDRICDSLPWQNMYLTQPPATKISWKAERLYRDSGSICVETHLFGRKSGVLLSDIAWMFSASNSVMVLLSLSLTPQEFLEREDEPFSLLEGHIGGWFTGAQKL